MINPFFYGGWKYYLPVYSGSRVLYFGRPEGVFSLLSEECQPCAVVPDEVAGELLMDLVRSQIGKTSVQADCAVYRSIGGLPKGTFDTAVIHGWNEWSERMRAVHAGYSGEECLARAARALKSGGIFMVTGSGLSLIRAAMAASRMKLNLRGILTFKSALYGPELYKIESQPASIAFEAAARAAVHFLRGGGFGLIYVNGNGPAQESLLSRIVREHAEREIPNRSEVYHGSGGVYTLLTPDWIYRMPQFPESETRCAVNYETLRHLQTLRLPFRCPEPAGIYRRHGKTAYVESRLKGAGVNYLSATDSDRSERAGAALGALIAMQRQTLTHINGSDAKIREAILQPVAGLESYLDPSVNRSLAEFSEAFLDLFRNEPLQRSMSHGDFKIANTLWEDGKLTAVIDWDLSSRENFALIDYLTYDAFDRSVASGLDFCRAVAASRYEDFETGFYRRNFPELRAGRPTFAASVVFALLHYGFTHLHFLREDLKAQWYREHLGEPLRESVAAFLAAARREGAAHHV